tara:strand:+ start:37814 stop:38959 length:1146 start_codon:yes stop_codon:yes gene_type:complete
MKCLFFLKFIFLSFTLLSQTPTFQKLDSNMAIKEIDSSGIRWLDPRVEPFSVIGFEWIKNNGLFRRLPLNPDWKITDDVDELSNQTAGGQIRFQTNSRKILLKVHLTEKSGMFHMTATGQSGFDLYVETNNTQRYVKTARFSVNDTIYEAELLNNEKQKMQSYTLNFPLYNGVSSVSVGLEQDAITKRPLPFKRSGKFVIYGTSITQGGCVSRPGNVYSNILSRKLDVEFINLGFSGSGKGEPEMAHIINQISNISFIILDYEANAFGTIQNTLEPFVNILRSKHPYTPLLIMSKTRHASAIDGSKGYKQLIKNRDFQLNIVNQKRKKGDAEIYFLDGSKVLGDDYYECSVDGSHLTDLGSYRVAEGLYKKINEILKHKTK